MNKKFFIKGIVFPICIAVIIGLAFFIRINAGAEKLFPVPQKSVIAYHDELNAPSGATADLSAAKSNDLIGSISCNGELKLRLDADYSNLIDSASLSSKGAFPGETGCVYIEISSANVSKIGTEKTLLITAGEMEYNYEYTGEKLVSSKNEALTLMPKGKNTLIVYYRVTKGIGITSDYYALMYKEVG